MKINKKNLVSHSGMGGYAVQHKIRGAWKTIDLYKSVPGRSVMYSAFELVYGDVDNAKIQFAKYSKNFAEMEEPSGGYRILGLKSKKVYDCIETKNGKIV